MAPEVNVILRFLKKDKDQSNVRHRRLHSDLSKVMTNSNSNFKSDKYKGKPSNITINERWRTSGKKKRNKIKKFSIDENMPKS